MRLRGIVLGEAAAGLSAMGLTLDDGRAGVGGVTLVAGGDDGPRGIRALDLEPLPAAPPIAVESVDVVADGTHAIGARAVDHVVVLCGDVDATAAALGGDLRRVDERDGRRYGFVVAETALLELVGPAEPDDRPARLWGLALTVDDLDVAVAHLGDACGRAKPAVQPGRRIATVRHEALGLRTPTVLLTPRV